MERPVKDLKVWLDPNALRERALEALRRARSTVRPLPLTGGSEFFTLGAEGERLPDGLLSRSDAECYAAAINGEAEMARALLALLAELDEVRDELDKARAAAGNGDPRE